jgi:hypothetical protein
VEYFQDRVSSIGISGHMVSQDKKALVRKRGGYSGEDGDSPLQKSI